MRTLSVVALALLLAAPAAAQSASEADPLETMPLRYGPLGLSPTLAITDFGVDSNIFNSAGERKSDFTLTVVPRVAARLRTGRLLASGSTSTGFVYYNEYADERSVNYTADGRLDFDAGRLQPYVAAAFVDTRERLNAEVDVRAPRTQHSVAGGVRVRLGSKTGLSFDARRLELRYDERAAFAGVPLATTLNSRTTGLDMGVQMFLTPFTTLSLVTSVQQDRFTLSPERDADSFRILPTVEFDPDALIHGSLAVGYRRFSPVEHVLPDFSGLVAQGTLGWTVADRMKFDVSLKRDVQYSFEIVEPYYLLTGARVTVTQHVAGPFDVQALAGRQRMSYRTATLLSEDRTDDADLVGGGIGYRLTDTVRISGNFEYSRRLSDRPDRRYQRRRIYASLTYGL